MKMPDQEDAKLDQSRKAFEDHEAWFREQVRQGLYEADVNVFASDAAVKAVRAKWDVY